MQFGDWRYLSAYLVPAACWVGLTYGGWMAPGALWVGFVLVPLIELFVPARPENPDESQYQARTVHPFFDALLYLNVPILFALSLYYAWLLGTQDWTIGTRIASILNMGIVLGVCGINVAHELGHRQNALSQWAARLLLLPVLYGHFTKEHNYGHHVRVATPEDPATARRNEPVYSFYLRSIFEGYRHAWKLEMKFLRDRQQPLWRNEMIWIHLSQVLWLTVIGFLAGPAGLLTYVGAALIGILALESVNYIEHYGMIRDRLPSGRYEPQSDRHSWNSNHELGRIMLFELVRHADHHYHTARKYQNLRHLDASPQLPFGYPMSIILALLPPVWFRIMNPRVDAVRSDQ